MKILLIGEYSNLHATLAEGLRELGHEVTVISDGTRWRNYKRDINLQRKSRSKTDAIKYVCSLIKLLPRMRGYDVVQLINPDCFSLKAKHQYHIYRYLQKHNGKVFSGAFGCDWYWVHSGLNMKLFRYGDFYIGDKMRTDYQEGKKLIDEWYNTPKGEYSRYVNETCHGIPACLYEYKVCYGHYFPEKTEFIPLPIIPTHSSPVHETEPGRIRFFIGIDTRRSEYKGTDIMYKALCDIKMAYPDRCDIIKAEHLPFDIYERMMDSCDVILDQLYSYTPAMNALLAMSKGIICIGGGEPENYEILKETDLRPIINVLPNYDSVYHELEQLILHPEKIEDLKMQSIEYVRRHHDYIKVAELYAKFYNKEM